MRARPTAALAVLTSALLVAACGAPEDGPGQAGVDPAGGGELSFPLCEDLEPFRADESLYADRPLYVGNEQPTEEVLAWAEGKPGFAELWLDRERNGWVSVGFTEGVEERQAEIAEQFPDQGVVAVEVPYSLEELLALTDRISELDLNGHAGLGPSVHLGVVMVHPGFLSEERLAVLEPLVGEPICVSGLPESEMVADGDQPTEGEGWRLLGEGLTGEVYRTAVATTPEQYDALWTTVGLGGQAPAVDFQTEIVVWFGAVYGSGCPIRLDGVQVTEEGPYLHAVLVLPGNPGACNDDANPHSFVLAVERSFLPDGPFAVQLGPNDPPRGVPQERTVVDADLSVPGSVATDDQLGPDEELLSRSGETSSARSGDIIETGYPWLYELVVDPQCGVRFLGELNMVTWVSDDVGDEVPEQWEATGEEGMILVEVLLSEGPDPALEALAGDFTVTYRPATEADTCP